MDYHAPDAKESAIGAPSLDILFPPPIPRTLLPPGLASESSPARALLRVLRHNHEHHHAYIDSKWFHNHAAHHMLAIYALGCSAQRIERAYQAHNNLTPAYESPAPITDANFVEHLGKERFYAAYVAYFSRYLMDYSPLEVFQHFIFSPAYNIRSDLRHGSTGKKTKRPALLSRLFSGLLHPFIYTSYGIEFGIPGQLAEGLAQAAVQRSEQAVFLPCPTFSELGLEPDPYSYGPDTSLALAKRVNNSPLFIPRKLPLKHPTFSFHRRIECDTVFAVRPPERYVHQYSATIKIVGPAVKALVKEWEERWLLDTQSDADVEARLVGMVEEVIWGNVIWFGVGGWALRGDTGRAIDADFYVMHLVTSSIFLLVVVLPGGDSEPPRQLLPLKQRRLLLRTYLAVCASIYISRGRARTALPIAEFYDATHAHIAHCHLPPPPLGVGCSYDDSRGGSYDELSGPWRSIISTAIAHPDEHLPKMIRALATFAARWGKRTTSARFPPAPGQLRGSERLDGTLFLRVAALVVNRFVPAADEQALKEAGWDNQSGDLP
ncbi:hypothetical protein BJV74DRAFT_915329 [Russula compacta]|nr:hypothetical protein BJV74DRAFT_915329 [Russula compacta]